jgi:hypothetical protein
MTRTRAFVVAAAAAATMSISGIGCAAADTPTCEQSSTTTCAPPSGYELPTPDGGFSLDSPPKD